MNCYFVFRYFPNVMLDNVDQNVMTFILTAVCSPTYFKNPYLVAKIIEVLFVINPSVQVHLTFINPIIFFSGFIFLRWS